MEPTSQLITQSNAVKQDLQLAWSHERSYLPLLIERTDFVEQAEYWLEGSRWIEATDGPPAHWLRQLEADRWTALSAYFDVVA